MTSGRQRLDELLVLRGLAATRAQARALIMAGRVLHGTERLDKPGKDYPVEIPLTLEQPPRFVSRGGEKLDGFLRQFGVDLRNAHVLDVGASTGGFTEVLLERGARVVYAVDVGHGQMNPKLAADPRAILLEGVNARDLGQTQVPEEVDAVVADVSFIGLKLVLPAALKLAHKGAWLVALVKPQFEAGVGKVGKGGIVKDKSAQEEALQNIVGWLGAQGGWSVIGTMESPIAGGDGNREFLLAARKS